MRTRKMALLLVVAFAVAACGGDGGDGTTTTLASTTSSPAGTEITVRATEFMFDPNDFDVAAGTPITFVLVNEGVVEHDFTIEEINLKIATQAGETKQETVTIPAGDYVIFCSVPGHREAGMTATLTAG